jgi:uncharacterized phage protein gp47/JayE
MVQTGLIFNPATGLSVPDTADIREGITEDWVRAFYAPDQPPLDTEPTTPAGQLVDAEVAEIEAKNAAMLFLANQFNPQVAEGRWQDALGAIYFLTRKLDEPTVVTCQLTGLKGTVIPYGALVQSATGYVLICNRSVSIGADNRGETTFRVAETGPVEIPAHSVTSIITTIPGWDTVDNAAAGAIGRDLETRAEFEGRRAASVAMNSHGSTGALFGAIGNIPGVLDVAVLENIGPNPVIKYGVEVPGHGVTICVYGGEDGDIARAIYQKKDNGCDTGGNTDVTYVAEDYHHALYEYKILRPEPVNFWIQITLGNGSNATAETRQALKEALYRNFYGLDDDSDNARVGMASTVFASRFYSSAMAVEGIKNIQSIKIALSPDTPWDYADVIVINGSQVPTISTDNISVLVA